jgi:hypothetical protein
MEKSRRKPNAREYAPYDPAAPKIKAIQFMLNEADTEMLDLICRNAKCTRSNFVGALVETQLHAIREIVTTNKPKLMEAVIQGSTAANRFTKLLDTATAETQKDMIDMAALEGAR